MQVCRVAPVTHLQVRLKDGIRAAAIAVAMLLAVSSLPSASHAQSATDAPVSERSVMATYIYRFITYAEWPASVFPNADAPIVIGVVNADDIAAELEQVVRGRTAQNRRLQVRRIGPSEAVTDAHVLFVGRDVAPKYFQAAKSLAERPVLTITDSERGADQGSMINFVQADGRVRFEVNVAVAEKSGIRLSSKLLTVAMRVRPG